MKKFLSKKPVMITFIALAVVMIAFYIGMMVRPVSYGMNYVYKNSVGDTETTTKLKINSDKTMRLTSTRENDGKVSDKTVMEYWIFRDEDSIYQLGVKKYISGIEDGEKVSKDDIEEANEHTMSKDDYKKAAEALKKASKKGEVEFAAALLANGAYEVLEDVSIYDAELNLGDAEAKCSGAIVFTVVGAVVVVALVAVASLSVVFTVKGKKRK